MATASAPFFVEIAFYETGENNGQNADIYVGWRHVARLGITG
jgi:hypothetical protein